MDEGLAAIADTATGAALSRAAEPGAGEGQMAAAPRCLNCGAFLSGAHCHQCGQSAHVHRHVGAFGHDFLHSVLHFDGKVWNTLPLLTWRPGELTRRYIEGERAQFISPLALFLFSVFLTFAVFNWVGIGADPQFNAEQQAAAETEFRQASAQIDRQIAEARTNLAEARAEGKPTAALEAELTQRERAAELFGLGERFANDESRDTFNLTDATTGIPFIDEGVAKANENPALTLYKLQNNSYKYSWLLILISAPFLWLLFPFSRRFGWYDHLVFVTYSISFMMLMWATLRVLTVAGVSGDLLLSIGTLYPPFHIYRQLRGSYRCSRFGGLIRAFILTFVATITLTMFFLLLVALGAME
jgi:hypothetical protein